MTNDLRDAPLALPHSLHSDCLYLSALCVDQTEQPETLCSHQPLCDLEVALLTAFELWKTSQAVRQYFGQQVQHVEGLCYTGLVQQIYCLANEIFPLHNMNV